MKEEIERREFEKGNLKKEIWKRIWKKNLQKEICNRKFENRKVEWKLMEIWNGKVEWKLKEFPSGQFIFENFSNFLKEIEEYLKEIWNKKKLKDEIWKYMKNETFKENWRIFEGILKEDVWKIWKIWKKENWKQENWNKEILKGKVENSMEFLAVNYFWKKFQTCLFTTTTWVQHQKHLLMEKCLLR